MKKTAKRFGAIDALNARIDGALLTLAMCDQHTQDLATADFIEIRNALIQLISASKNAVKVMKFTGTSTAELEAAITRIQFGDV